MEIKTKYEIGQKIWCVFINEQHNELEVFTDIICEIVWTSKGLRYYLKDLCDEVLEEEIILYEDTDTLLQKIIELEKQIDKLERGEK